MPAGITGYYDILNVSRDASVDEIKKAFRALARKFHPDKNPGDREAEEKFKEISRAYEVLADPQARMLYDRTGSDYDKFAGNGNPGYPFGGFPGRGRKCGFGRGCGFKHFSGDGNYFYGNIKINEISISEEDVKRGTEISVKPDDLHTDRIYRIKLPKGIENGSIIRYLDEENGNEFFIKINFT